jgi:hypothetical protein
MRQVLWVGIVLILVGCGYVPASQYARNVLGESVSTEVKVSMEDPQNTVLIKDAVDTAVITKFRVNLTSKENAKTQLTFRILGVGFTPLRYDLNGYVSTYRASVTLAIHRASQEKQKDYSVAGVYDFDIAANALLSDQARFTAIQEGATKALDSFIAQVASEGVTNDQGDLNDSL